MTEDKKLENLFCEEEEEFDIIKITTEDNEEIDCAIIDTFKIGEKEYIAIIALSDIEDENSMVKLYELKVLDDGQPDLIVIEDDKEFEKAVETFEKLMEEMEKEEEKENQGK